MLYKMQYQEYEANNMGHSQTRARPGSQLQLDPLILRDRNVAQEVLFPSLGP